MENTLLLAQNRVLQQTTDYIKKKYKEGDPIYLLESKPSALQRKTSKFR